MNRLELLIESLEARFGTAATVAIIVVAITAISIFFAYPLQIFRAYYAPLDPDFLNARFIYTYMPLTIHPWHTRFSEPTYQAFRHRILGPVIAWSLHLRGRNSAPVAPLANPFIYLVSYVFLRKKVPACTAFLATVVLSLTLACVTSQVWVGFQDSLASLFLLLAFVVASPWLSAVFLLIGMLADERILAAALLIIFWHDVINAADGNWFRPARIRASWFAGVAAVWLVYMLLQKHFYGTDFKVIMAAAHDNFLYYKRNVWLGWYYGLRGGWILSAALILWWIESKQYFKAMALVIATIPILAISLQVGDLSRVASIAFPTIVIAVICLYQVRPLFLNHLLVGAMLVQTCSPIQTIVAQEHRPIEPLPLVVIDSLFGAVPHNRKPATSQPGSTALPQTAPSVDSGASR